MINKSKLFFLLVILLFSTAVNGEKTGFIMVRPYGKECRAVSETAKSLFNAELIQIEKDCRFTDETGKEISLDDYTVLWIHKGDSTEQSYPLFQKKSF